MPGRVRGSNGQFITSKIDQDEETTPKIIFPNTRINLISIVKFVVIVFVISPWMFIIIKNISIGTITKSVEGFYDNHFTCNSVCLNRFNSSNGNGNIKDDRISNF